MDRSGTPAMVAGNFSEEALEFASLLMMKMSTPNRNLDTERSHITSLHYSNL